MKQISKPRLLYLSHCYHNRAGVEEHLKTLSGALEDRYEIFIAFPQDGRLCLMRSSEEPLFLPAERVSILAPLQAPQTQASLAKILEIARPDLIHIVHFVNWPLSMIQQTTASGVPVVMSFHDYYAVTPHFTMQGESDPFQTTSAAYALKVFGKDISSYLLQRRAFIASALQGMKALAVPSPYLARVLGGVFPCRFEVIEYGIRPFALPAVKKDWSGLRFGYLGTLLPQKGWEPLLAAFQSIASQHPQAEIHFFGGAAKLPPSSRQIRFHGVYEQSQLPHILSSIDVGVVPSVFAETYSLVLSEMWHAGLPVAVSDIGAMSERVMDSVNGRKFKPGDVGQIAEVLTWFITTEVWKDWAAPAVRLDADMAQEYDAWYQKALK